MTKKPTSRIEIAVYDPKPCDCEDLAQAPGAERVASTTSGSARKRRPQPRAHRQLEIPGLVPERHTLDGEPKHTLLEWAERWNADCIFIGASGRQHPDTETLGTVASALAVRAHCSVEIVRPCSAS